MSPALPAPAAFSPSPGSHQAPMQPCQLPAGPDSQPCGSRVQEAGVCPPLLPPCPDTHNIQPRGGSSRAAPASFQHSTQHDPTLCPAPSASQVQSPIPSCPARIRLSGHRVLPPSPRACVMTATTLAPGAGSRRTCCAVARPSGTRLEMKCSSSR